MIVARRKDAERLALGLALAMVFHAALFLVLHFGKLLIVEDIGGYLGPITVQLDVPPSLPVKTTGETEEAPPRDQPEPEESEKPVEQVEPEKPVESPIEKPETLAGDAGPSDVLPVEKETEETPEAESESSEPPYEPPEAKPQQPEDAHIFSQTDKSGGEFTVEMANKTNSAKPAIRIPIELPSWVYEKKEKLEVTFSFVVGGDNRITYLNVDKSSGHKDFDDAVIRSLREWAFSNPTSQERILGTFTYRYSP
jgi:TonB family protein